jgi:hypothetical protein
LVNAPARAGLENRRPYLLRAYRIRLEQAVGALSFIASGKHLGDSTSWSSRCAIAYADESTSPAMILHLRATELLECPRTWT